MKRKLRPGRIRTLPRPREEIVNGPLRWETLRPELENTASVRRPRRLRFLNTNPIGFALALVVPFLSRHLKPVPTAAARRR